MKSILNYLGLLHAIRVTQVPGANDGTVDALETYLAAAIARLNTDHHWQQQVRERGIPWRGATEKLKEQLPKNLADRDDIAFQNVRRLLDQLFGAGAWTTCKKPRADGTAGQVTWIEIDADPPPPPNGRVNGNGSGNGLSNASASFATEDGAGGDHALDDIPF